MIVQMKMRAGCVPFNTLTVNWTPFDLSQLDILQRYMLITLINKYIVLIGCDNEECISSRKLVIDYLK